MPISLDAAKSDRDATAILIPTINDIGQSPV